jgi:hypothetical protein
MFMSSMLVPISPEKWIELLTLYGPMALFVFMVFVLLRMARAKVDEELRSIQNIAYLLVWVSIFALAAIIVVVYWNVLSGKITNLTYPQIVTTEQELFLHRHTIAGLDFEYDWRLISDHPFTGTIELLLQKKPTDAQVLKYKLPILREFYANTVEVEYDQTNDQLNVKYGNNQIMIKPSAASIAGATSPDVPDEEIVYAESRPDASPDNLILALDVDDPLIRLNARRDLAKLGSAALPYLAMALTNQESSYRLRVGVLAVLLDLGVPTIQGLSEAGRCSILKASNDADPTLRDEAKAVLGTGVKVPSRCATLSSPFQKIRPTGLAYLRSGMLILDEYDKQILQVQSGALRKLQDLGSGTPLDIAALQLDSNSGAAFVITATTGNVGRLEMYSDVGAVKGDPQRTWMPPPPVVKAFLALAADSATHSIYLASPAGHSGFTKIMRLDLSGGTNSARLVDIGELGPQFSETYIRGIAADSNGRRLFAVDEEGELFMVKLPASHSDRIRGEKISIPHSLNNPRALAMAVSDEMLYAIARKKVWKLSLVGNSAEMQQFAPNHAFRSPSALAVDADGDIWVADEDGHKIYEMAPDGHLMSSFPK